MPRVLNVARLINDLGGAAKVAAIAGVARTAPYGWIRRRYVSSQVLERIKEAAPHLSLDAYFEEETNGDGTGGSS